jgi:hypothetical protein
VKVSEEINRRNNQNNEQEVKQIPLVVNERVERNEMIV